MAVSHLVTRSTRYTVWRHGAPVTAWLDSDLHAWHPALHHTLASLPCNPGQVKTLTGKEIEIDIEPTDTIARMKERLEEREGIPPVQQRWVVDGGTERTWMVLRFAPFTRVVQKTTGSVGSGCARLSVVWRVSRLGCWRTQF